MIENAKALIASRRSVRTFSDEELKGDVLSAIAECVAGETNPFGVEVEFRLLDAKKHGLSSPVIVGEKYYLAAKAKRGSEIAYGYSFEYALLYALSLGVGSVMLGSSLNRAAFEKAMEVAEFLVRSPARSAKSALLIFSFRASDLSKEPETVDFVKETPGTGGIFERSTSGKTVSMVFMG